MDFTKSLMPKELKRICTIFKNNNLIFNFFKCEHIFEGANKNLDLLFLYDLDYNRVSKILREQGYVLYLNEKVEKYKRMFIRFENGILSSIHLHREVAWHGLPVLDKKLIFKRSNDSIPSAEDSLLIHSAHALFENFKVKPYHKKLLEKYKKEAKDWDYINFHLSKQGWKKQFYKFIKDFSVSKNLIIETYLARLAKDPLYKFNLILKLTKSLSRKFSLKRKGLLIALIGVNGAGKTTLANELLKAYKPLTDFMHGQKGYYFGWDPFLPTTRILSKVNENNTPKLNNKVKKHKKESSLKSLYIYMEYLSRYLFKIYPHLQRRKVVVTDRYFYDLFAQDRSKNYSLLQYTLLKMFPKPDFLFILDAPLEFITKRDKNTKLFSKDVKRSKSRIIHSDNYLTSQKEKYYLLSKIFDEDIICTTEKIDKNIKMIISKTWGKIIKS